MFSVIILILTISEFHLSFTAHRVSEKLRKKLNIEERNAICCKHHLRCCNSEKTTTFEVKAIVTDCPKLQCTNDSNNQKVVVNSNNPPQEKLTNCHQKLLLSIKMTDEGVPNDKSQYIIIDHIVDAVTTKKVGILNPYAVRIRQQPVQQVYPLHFDRAVNAEAQEQVYNKENPNFRGCSTDVANPTCRIVRHEGKVVPYSTGFCCSCDPEENAKGQWPVPEDRKNPPENARYKHYGFTRESKAIYGEGPKHADQSADYRQFIGDKIRQRRGGQDCDDIDVNAIPQSFHESAHCLTFSDLWYSVYNVQKPKIVHKLRIQIFQKYEDCHGNTHWLDLIQGKVVELGSHRKLMVDKSIIARYCAEEIDDSSIILDYESIRILVPEKHASDPDQFMVLPRSLISADGSTCDTAGVGYEAFYKQQKRCAQPKGSCLHNQPKHLYDQDVEAEQRGRAGNYFLKFHGILAPNPVKYNSSGQLQYLKMVHTARYVSNLYFELNADLVTVLKPNNFATITEVYTDATNPRKTRIVVKVMNSGLLYGVYYVRLSGCPMEMPASFNNIASKSVLILPQHQHIFNLYIEYPLPVAECYCSIHVHNINQELLAVRAIRIQTYDRCICIWHCTCACYVNDRGLKCTPMSLDAYHQAGFQGGFPFPSKLVESSYLDDVLVLLLHMFTYLVVTLLIMGLIKALLGLVCKEIGLWGLDAILGTEKRSTDIICDNEECEWRQKQDDGISCVAQFCLNLIFFFIYPLVLCNVAIRKCCFGRYTMENDKSYERNMYDYEECDGECVDECEAECNRFRSSTNDTVSMKYTGSIDGSSMTTNTSKTSMGSKQSFSSGGSRRSRVSSVLSYREDAKRK